MRRIKLRYRYWSLIKEISLTDFKLKYQGSFFGYLWSLVRPISYFAVLYFIFTQVFKIGNTISHYPIYLLIGIVFFQFWGDATTAGMYAIVNRSDLIRKVYFPRITLVLSSTTTALITFILNMAVVIIFAIFNNVSFDPSMFVSIFYIFELYLFILGVSFYLSALFVKFRDIGHIWEVINLILFYATPILYTLSLVPNNIAKLMVLSPLAQVILDFRNAFLGRVTLTTADFWSFYFIPYLIVALLLVSGYYFFQKMAAKFAEEV